MKREEVIRQVVQRDVEHRALLEEQVLQESPELHTAACEHFGTWHTALNYAGINLHRVSTDHKYTDEDVLRTIRYLCCNGYNLTANHNIRRDRRLYEAARQHLGTCGVSPARRGSIAVRESSHHPRSVHQIQHH